jgi:hypothetical protein
MARAIQRLISLTIGGEVYQAKGNFTYNGGGFTREAIMGADGVHGAKETPRVAFVEGEITDIGDVDVRSLAHARDVQVDLELANGKMFTLTDAWAAGDFTSNTEEGNIGVRFEAERGEEIQL